MATKKTSTNKKKVSRSLRFRIIDTVLLIIVALLIYFYTQGTFDPFLQRHNLGQFSSDIILVPSEKGTEEPIVSTKQTVVPEPQGTVEQPVTTSDLSFQQGFEIPLCAETHEDAADHQVISYKGFTLCYRESFEQPEWVAYELKAEELVKNASRSDNFRKDPQITTGSATPEDYLASGYDRGHIAPAGDMVFDKEAMSESFYMSNMSPQSPSFNRGIWNKLEAQVRNWALEYGYLYVISGPVLEKTKYPTIGENEVAIPEYYYKVLLTSTTDDKGRTNYQTIAFLLPNQKISDSFWNYVVSIDEVEKRTQLDFFSQLPDSFENGIESSIMAVQWQ
jgi:endonuclease G